MYRTKKRLLIFIVWLITLTASETLQAQNNRNSISGVVTDSARKTIPDLWIELLNEVDSVIYRIRTDATGRYIFRNLSFGTFQVRIVTSGTNFVSQTVRVSLYPATMQGTGSHYEQQDFILRTASENKGGTTKARTVFAQNVPDTARKLFETAVVRFDSNDAETGIARLKEALAIFPGYYLALERLGIEYLKTKNLEQAGITLKKALEINPNGAPSLYALGVVQYQTKLWDAAVEVLQRSIILEPESSNAAFINMYLGLALLKTDKAAKAEPYLKRAIETGGERIPPDIHLHLAEFYGKNNRFKEAADELELFLKLVPDARDSANIRNLITQLRAKSQPS